MKLKSFNPEKDCEVKYGNTFGTGFFCEIPHEADKMKVLMTNYHVLDDKYFNQNNELILFINDDKEIKTIKLGTKRKTYFNKEYDIAIIELKENDNIKNYLELDDNIFKEETKAYYKDISIYIIQYPNGKNAAVSYGLSVDIDNYQLKHICSTDHGSSGSPILNLSNNKVIGIHKQGSKIFNFNMGTLLHFPLNEFINNKKYNFNSNYNNNTNYNNKIINYDKNKSNQANYNDNKIEKIFADKWKNDLLNEIFNDVKNECKPGPKMNITFKTIQGKVHNIIVNFETTIDQLLRIYLKRINRVELIKGNNNICFLWRAYRLKFWDKSKIFHFFEYCRNPIIVVVNLFPLSFVNWTNEEDKIINLQLDKLVTELLGEEKKLLDLQREPIKEKEITVKFKNVKKNIITEIKMSNLNIVGELLNEYFLKTKEKDGIFILNGFLLHPSDSSCLYELYYIGLKDNSVIFVKSRD